MALKAGAFAAFTVDILVYPLDTLKTRIQSPDYSKLYLNGTTRTVNKPVLFRGLYQGLGSVILATLPSSGAFFTTYEGVKSVLSRTSPKQKNGTALVPQPLINSAASATAELVSCAILAPAEVIKQNAQMVTKSSKASEANKVNATLQTLARFRSNPLALWRGYSALAGRNLPFTALQFPMYERFKESLRARRVRAGISNPDSIVENALITAASAASAGAIAAVVTTPIDVVKTRIMLAAVDVAASAVSLGELKATSSAPTSRSGSTMADKVQASTRIIKSAVQSVKNTPRHKSSRLIAQEILVEHGIKGLFRGGALRAVWTMLGSGLYLSMYETCRVYLAQRRGQYLGPSLDVL